jgi:hypothetical protein
MKRQPVMFNPLLEPGAWSSDRRLSPRYPVVKNRAFLAWRTEAESCETAARLLNISNGGALVLAERQPVRGKAVWIRLGEPVATEWVEARIVRMVKLPGLLWFRKASHLVQLCFTEPCPYQLFKSATHGEQLDAAPPEPTLPEHDNRYWR